MGMIVPDFWAEGLAQALGHAVIDSAIAPVVQLHDDKSQALRSDRALA